jgi:bacterioferritin-associated ferredoxin
MYVCICRAVTEAEVRGCIAQGACTLKDVVARSAAGTGCGSCVGKIVALLSADVNGMSSSLQHSA